MISAVVLAAGSSRRMGKPKMTLPWGDTSVIGHVLRVLQDAEVQSIVVVTGAAREAVQRVCRLAGVTVVFNPRHRDGEMLASLQVGLKSLGAETDAALIVLGDQPSIAESTVRQVIQAHQGDGALLVVPSYRMRRGHPWLVARPLWTALLDAQVPATPRDFLNLHASHIAYVEVGTPSILEDLDTQADYLKSRP
jgi:molybdenum cofactor cytidylyltransferase